MRREEVEVRVSRGMHSLIISSPQLRITFKVFHPGLEDNAVKEYIFLRELHSAGLPVPEPYGLVIATRMILIREYIAGKHFHEFLADAPLCDSLRAILSLLEVANLLDIHGVFLDELSFPTKNIIVQEPERVFVIDFERAVRAAGRSNVTQILGFLVSSLKSKGIVALRFGTFLDPDALLKLSQSYRRTRDFRRIREYFQEALERCKRRKRSH